MPLLYRFFRRDRFLCGQLQVGFSNATPYLAGITFGVAVYLVVNSVVLPLSRVHRAPFSLSQMVIAVFTHMVCVGLPIAFTIRRYSV
jgi:hypothetical protein